jgi:hypothetical protein
MWLKLTLADGSPILINMDKFSWGMTDDNNKKLTFYKDELGFNGEVINPNGEEIKETFDEVWDMMQKFQTGK